MGDDVVSSGEIRVQVTTDDRAAIPAAKPAARSRWRRFTPLLVALAVVLLAEGVARAAATQLPPYAEWNSVTIDQKYEQIRRVAATGGAQVVFLGSSVAQDGFLPDVFLEASGFESAYNASLNGATARLLEAWTLEVVMPMLDPDVVVFGLTSRELNDNSVSGELIHGKYLESPGRAAFLGEATFLDRVDKRLTSLSALLQLKQYFQDPRALVDAWGSTEEELDLDRFGAEHIGDPPYDPRSIAGRIRSSGLAGFRVGDVEGGALDRLVVALQQAGVAVVVVDMPVVENDYAPLHPDGVEDLEEYRAALRSLAERRSVVLVDGRELLDETAGFADFLHLNETTATAFSARVAPLIEAAATD